MKFARIVPPQWEAHFPTGEYRMALAPWVLGEVETYPKFLRRGAEYVIMDSGTFEDNQCSVGKLNEAATKLGADEVILPDVLGDSKETLLRSWNALGRVATKRVMFVPQGHTKEEWKRCLHSWLDQWNQSYWSDEYELALGLSSLRIEGSRAPQIGTRIRLLHDLVATGLPFHLLGVGDPGHFVERELPLAFRAGARGVDTSLAFAVGAAGKLLTPSVTKVPLGPPENYETLSSWTRRLISLNLRIMTQWVTQGEAGDRILTRWIRQTSSKWLKYWAPGFADLQDTMEACGMPKGKYALLREDGREIYIRPLKRFERPGEDETLIEL